MTPKELLYIEDALGHEMHMVTKCKDYAAKFEDSELKQLAKDLASKHQKAFDKIYKLLN